MRQACLITGPSADPDAPARHLIVVPDLQALRARRAVNIRDLLRFELETCGVVLAPGERITGFDVRFDPLPTASGTVDRAEAQRQWAHDRDATRRARGAAPADQLGDDEAASAVRQAIGVRRPSLEPSRGTHLDLDLGLDSIERVEMLLEAERRAAVVLDPGRTWEIVTAGDLVEALRAAPRFLRPWAAADDPWARVLDAEPATGASTAEVARATPVRATIGYAVLRVAALLGRMALRVRVTGIEHLPDRGPFVLAPNHQSYLDGFLICSVLPLRLIRGIFIVGAPEYFATALLARIATFFHLVPVDPDSNLVGAMQTAAAGLRAGRVLLIFPEGERSLDGNPAAFRKGTAILAARLSVPIVPVAIDGAFSVWPRGRGLAWRALRPGRRPLVQIAFGSPISPGHGGVPVEAGELTVHLRGVVEGMLRELRGQRADRSPAHEASGPAV